MFAAAISRWAARIDGMLRERLYLRHPAALDVIDEIDRTGIVPPLGEGAFPGFCHRPGELRDEVAEAGLEVATWSASRDRRSYSATWTRGWRIRSTGPLR